LVTALAGALTGAFAATFGALFFSAFRAAGAALWAGADGFDFAVIFSAAFLDLATALAMAFNNPDRGQEEDARLTPL
jgi:hypothetical protein